MPDERISILRVPFDRITLNQTLDRLEQACKGSQPFLCVTPNPEICLEAQKNPEFLHVLRSADLSIPDGFGILWASRYLSGKTTFFRWILTLLTPWRSTRFSPLPERVTGTDVFQQFTQRFPERKVFLLGAAPAVNDALAKKLKNLGVHVVGNFSGDASPLQEHRIRSLINNSQAEVLFVAFGAPKQELWLYQNLPHLRNIKLAMGIGGAFDFVVGKRKRAPHWMRMLGLEWLFRLIIEPRRIQRIIRATLVFPWKVWRDTQQ